MAITTTAIGFIVLSLGLALYGWRFLKASKSFGRTGILISFYYLSFAIQNAIIGFGALLLAKNPFGLFAVFVGANIFLTFVAILGIYTMYYIISPEDSPWIPISLTFIVGLIGTFFSISIHVQPYITFQDDINWNAPLSISLILFYLLLISIGSSLYIFIKLFFQSSVKEIKILSLVLAGGAIGGIVDNFVRFVLIPATGNSINTSFYDIGSGLIGLLFIIVFPLISFSRAKR